MKYQICFVLLISLNIYGYELGKPVVSGKACNQVNLGRIKPADNLLIPMRISVVKNEGAGFVRATCNVRWPIKLAANEKIKIQNLQQLLKLNLKKDTSVKYNLNVGLVGLKSKNYDFVFDNIETTEKTIKSEGLISESLCGKDAILSINLNVVASGAAATINSDELGLSIISADCR